MNDIDAWIYFDGPEPDHIRPLLDALRDLPPATPEDKERLSSRFFEKLDPMLSERSGSSVATGARLAQASGDRSVGEDGASAESPAFVERTGAALPGELLAPEVQVDEQEPGPAAGRPPEDWMGTAPMAALPAEAQGRRGGLPFKPRRPGTELEVTEKVPVLDPRKGETATLRDDSIAAAVAALPFAGNTVGRSLVPFPQLSLQEYASLCAELSVSPERSAAILPKYHVMNEAARQALDAHWQMQLAANPEMRIHFENALGIYTTWLRSQSR